MNRPIYDRIEQKLTQALDPVHLKIVDNSLEHAGHTGANHPSGETHFEIEIVSPVFEGMSKIARHKRVYEVLADEITERVHAISITTVSPQEYICK
jgi:BolA protein